MLLKPFIRYNNCFHRAINYFFHFDIYVATTLIGVQVILFYYLLVNKFDCYFTIINLLHLIVQVEVIYMYCKLFPVWGGEGAAPMEFGHD